MSRDPSGAVEDLARSALSIAEASGFSGVIRIDEASHCLFEQGFGLAHRGFGIRNEVSTQFAIASGTKGFTALTVVSLIVDGALSLESTARSVLGDDLPLIGEDVTVEQLLGHRSGIGDYLDEEDESLGELDHVLRQPVYRYDSTAGYLPDLEGHPTKFPPGERFAYSNSGYVVLALLAERVSGVPFHDLVETRVLAPAGLQDTGFLRSDEPSGRMALGYLKEDGLRTNVHHLPVKGSGDGGMYTTASDMRTLWTALFDGEIVPADWVRLMTTRPGDGGSYGLGFWLGEWGSSVELIGSDPGVSFASSHNPTTSLTWSVLSNTTEGAWPVVRGLRSMEG